MELLRIGSRGQAVKELQEQLTRLGYRLAIDGIFGQETARTVKAFQTKSRIAVDGIVGNQTRTALAKALNVPVNKVIQSMRPITPSSTTTTRPTSTTRINSPVISQGSSKRWVYWAGFGFLTLGALAYFANEKK